MIGNYNYGTGRRKSAVARVFIKAGSGKITVNGKPAKASVAVKEGDQIEIQFGSKAVKVEVLSVQETVKKEAAAEMYRYL